MLFCVETALNIVEIDTSLPVRDTLSVITCWHSNISDICQNYAYIPNAKIVMTQKLSILLFFKQVQFYVKKNADELI